MILSKNAFSSTTVKYRLGLTFRSKIDIFPFLQKTLAFFTKKEMWYHIKCSQRGTILKLLV